jgi:hypothetical protein
MYLSNRENFKPHQGDRTMRQTSMRIKKYLFLALIMALLFSSETHAQKIQTAFVTKGAFILSENPTIWKSGRLVHELIAYLPIGTVVYFDYNSAIKKLFNWESDQEEKYLFVETDIGMTGLLREDLKVNLEKAPVLIPVGNRSIPIYTSNSTKDKVQKLSEFSRSDGEYLRLIDDKDDEFYNVELTWPKGKSPPDRGKIRKRWVNIGEVLLLSQETINQNPPHVSRGDHAQKDDYLSKIAQKVQDTVGMKMEEVLSFLKDLDSFQCMLSAGAKADLGVKIFGTGLGLEFALNLKKEDRIYKLGQCTYYRGEEAYKQFIILKDVVCKDNRPHRLVNFVIQEIDLDPAKRTLVSIEDLPDDIKKEWKTSFQGKDAPKCMIRIDGYDNYYRVFSLFEKEADQGGGYLSTLNAYDRRIVINIILSEIAYFKRPEIR